MCFPFMIRIVFERSPKMRRPRMAREDMDSGNEEPRLGHQLKFDRLFRTLVGRVLFVTEGIYILKFGTFITSI